MTNTEKMTAVHGTLSKTDYDAIVELCRKYEIPLAAFFHEMIYANERKDWEGLARKARTRRVAAQQAKTAATGEHSPEALTRVIAAEKRFEDVDRQLEMLTNVVTSLNTSLSRLMSQLGEKP